MSVLELPIFPLPLVLFPGVSQLLHIFEPRYRQMLSDCMQGNERFGISWVDPQGKEDPAPEEGTVGCIAHVRAVTSLPDGRSNILTVGEERYRLLNYSGGKQPYRVARVETFTDEDDAEAAREIATRVAQIYGRFSAALGALNDSPVSPSEIPDNPAALSFQVAAALELEPPVKQDLLALRSTQRRLEMLERILRAVIADLGPKAEIHVRARKNGKGGANAAIVRGT